METRPVIDESLDARGAGTLGGYSDEP